MSSEWDRVHLGALTVNLDTRRKPVKESDRKPGPYPYYGASGIVDYVEGFLFEGEHLLIAEDGENLKTRQTPFAFIAHGKFWVNNHAHIVTGNERASTRFLQYALLATDISAYLTGAVMPKLTQGNLNRIELPCPPRDVQDQIVGILGGLDDRITLLRETNATLEAIAQALFKSWFVDFDPVRAKMEGRAPEGMDEATAALFPDALEESELGWVPKGWRMGEVGDFARLRKGTVNPGIQPDTVFEHFSLPAFDDDQRPVIEQGATIKSNKTPVPSDAVLLSKLNPHIPRIWLPGTSGRNAICSTEFLIFQPTVASCRELIYCAFSSTAFIARLQQLVTGTSNSHQRIKPDQVAKIEHVVPTPTVVKAFESLAAPLFERVHANRLQAQTLSTLRDTLLPRLISGQLRLPEAQTATEAALSDAFQA
jgi:type I restriction enzyme S subunit